MFFLLFAGPHIFDLFTLLKVTLFISMAILALSMGFIWGYGGILCFGQSAFFGLGAYTYAIAVGNIGESTAPFFLAIIVPAAFAALLGYFMFYGRLSDVYLAVVTLAVTLILYNFMRSTAGEEYAIGSQRLMGFNGISAIAPVNWPGNPKAFLFPQEIFYLAMGCLILCYFGLKFLLKSHFGRVAVAIRENELRAELLGYDVRMHKLLTFTIGGAIAGLAGCLSIFFKSFVNPDVFALTFAAEIIMWALIGGLGTLVGPILGCIALLMLKFEIGQWQALNPYLIFGGIIMLFVLVVPGGVLPTARNLLTRYVPGVRERGAEAAETGRESAR
jgi:branched-chain amino acid transport system permease protein